MKNKVVKVVDEGYNVSSSKVLSCRNSGYKDPMPMMCGETTYGDYTNKKTEQKNVA